MDPQRRWFLKLSALATTGVALAGTRDPGYWPRVFDAMPAPLARIAMASRYQVQLRCIRVTRDSAGVTRFVAHDHGMAPRRWFPAASVAKLPMALLLAEHLHARGLDGRAGIGLHAPPATGAWNPAEPLTETFARGLARTFAVSDNVPYNRWYEFLGADHIHDRLAAHGYADVRLISRLGSPDPQANRRTGGGLLTRPDGTVVEERRGTIGKARSFPYGRALAGRGWRREDGVVKSGPHDFSFNNFLPLAASLGMLQALAYPESVPPARRWLISEDLRVHLLRAVSLRPRDSIDPRYPEATHPDGYARWFFVGGGVERYPAGLRVMGKSGMAYGSLSEVACVVDTLSGAEFLLGASVYCDEDGIFNDDRYDYVEIGLPFMAALGHAVLAVERQARRAS